MMGKFTTFIIGGVIGAAAGFFLSPRTGAENRARLGEAMGTYCKVPEGVQERAGQLVGAAANTSTKVINAVVDNGSEAYKNVATKAQAAINPAAQSLSTNGDELRAKIDAARERIAAQVAKNAEAARDAAVDKVPVVFDAAQSATAQAKGAAHAAQEAVASAASTVAFKVAPASADKAPDSTNQAAH